MQKKKNLSFGDLGLSTPLPSVLAKAKKERKQEKAMEKRDKKGRTKEAMDLVAASRQATEQHKQFVIDQQEEERIEKEKRKREMKIEHLRAQNERAEDKKQLDKTLLAAQQKYVAAVEEKQQEADEKEKLLRAQIQLETERVARTAPRSVHIPIMRTELVQQQREGLPVLREEQPIVEAINDASRSCVLLCGETGSGKTTQIPQFLWEAGYGHAAGAPFGREGAILVTEPRRVAAVSMARRVAEELSVSFGGEVGYHVRYDNNISDACKLKFATEGIVLKEIQSDFLLKKYSVIIVDEAHERSVSCDILIGLLSRIVPLRNELHQEELRRCHGVVEQTKVKPLKLVIMSATMRVMDFRDNKKLFPITPQLINVEARRFTVSNHFARKTVLKEYVDEAFAKVCQVHKKLPPGGILVFLCTQHEIEDLCSRLRSHYAKTKIEYYENSYSKHALLTGKSPEEGTTASDDEEKKKVDGAEEEQKDEFGLKTMDYALEDDNDERAAGGAKRAREASDADSEAGSQTAPNEEEMNGEYNTLHVLPLYALLDFEKQQEVFKPPPPGKRLCVIATNVAETSITIPNIKYVVDSGRVKSKVLDTETQASCFRIEWTSQASAEQRSGRAGRVGPGHCYRLYSTAVYSNWMSQHTVPEVLRAPLDSVVLLMKHIGIEHVGGFPFPSAPREEELKRALDHLSIVGALNVKEQLKITALGRRLVAYPVPPKFARAVAAALDRRCPAALVDMVVAIVSVASTTTTAFTGEGNRVKAAKPQDNEVDPRRERVRSLLCPGSDLITYLRAFQTFVQQPRTAARDYCLVQKSMQEARMLYHQVCRLARQQQGEAVAEEQVVDEQDSLETTASPATMKHNEEVFMDDCKTLTRSAELQLRQLFIPGLLDQVARRATVHECRSLGVEYHDKKTSRTPYYLTHARSIAFIHPTSSIARTHPPPEYVTYAFLQRITRSETREAQTSMLGLTIVTKEWLNAAGFAEE
ncbi:ATP-dependent RNA helicase DHX37/DHR1 [Strigomonas culicis]|uniref:RNA helicase n=1 Tax=Strigomonas culicis TaxID=28005 RepID=S9VAV1_9TRYP|nr:ATP-dependent RNA helicase DHX37/DHR1 [Strigomonas culicis]|eukprot:EPY20200.1 ATP-dependent RNA helicase DHX37/DHR1 [Strigomonas culicis]